VSDLAARLRSGQATARELTETALAEAQRWEPVINAFATLDAAGARRAADEADRELAEGHDRGPLHGIPVGVKDLIDVAGLPTGAGSRHFAGTIAERDAECVRRIRAAGAVVLGKTTTHELAFGPTGDRAATGPTRNPYAPDRMSGGSSSGSAAAVAAGVVPLALGTDTGGSVRIPAALCGVVGLKPTSGALPLDGVLPLAPSLDTVGPMARTVADCRLLWTALAGDGPVGRPLTRREYTTPWPELRDAYTAIQGGEAFAVHAERYRSAPELFGEEVRQRLSAAGKVRGWEYVRARALRDRVRADVLAALGEDGFLRLPTVPVTAPRLDERAGDVRGTLLSLTSPWNVLGLPALTIPAGLDDGLPVGTQLVGPPGSEERLLATAETL